MNTTSAIRQFFLNHPNQIVDAAFLHRTLFPIIDYHTFLKSLSRIVDEGTAKIVDRGIYAPATLPDEQIPRAVLEYYTGNTNGMIVGDALYSQLGLAQRQPEKVQIYTNRVNDIKKKHVLNCELSGKNLVFDEPARNLITLLELIENRNKIPDLNLAKYSALVNGLANEVSRTYTNALFDEIRSAMSYRDSTIAAAKRLINEITNKSVL